MVVFGYLVICKMNSHLHLMPDSPFCTLKSYSLAG